ncbi:MAG TPA: hypothetical protein VI876_00120 [Dehalococcoidia bacterium]|nr:hypothetical protein [Dehalococcoidia bacterium]
MKAAKNSWIEKANLYGIDWGIEIHPPRSLRIPKATRRASPRTSWKTFPDCSALISVHTQEATINGARDVGRLAVRRLAGLIRREMPTLLLSDVLWEGAIAGTPRQTIKMMLAQPEIETVTPNSPAALHEVGLKLLAIEFGALPVQLGKALEWLALARSARVRIEKFTHLWLAVVALVDHGVDFEKVRYQRTRIENYVATMSDVLRSTERLALTTRLNAAYAVRNELWHEGMDTSITPNLLASLEGDAFRLVDFEFIKIGKPIPK